MDINDDYHQVRLTCILCTCTCTCASYDLGLFSQVERATVESYSGSTVPPCIEVTVTPAGDSIDTLPNLANLVNFTGMEQPHDIVLKKGVVGDINCK